MRPPATRAASARSLVVHAPTRAHPRRARRRPRARPPRTPPPPRAACGCSAANPRSTPPGAWRRSRGACARGAAPKRMQMRFTLQTRSPESPSWRALPAAGFGRWLTSDAGVGRYVYTKRVVSLLAPASYRTIVRFRWLDAGGDRSPRRAATSPVCRQPDLRPNLRPLGVQARAGADPEHARYVVPVVNRGRTRRARSTSSSPSTARRCRRRRRPSSRPASARSWRSRGRRARRQMLTVDVDPDRRRRRARRGATTSSACRAPALPPEGWHPPLQ